MSDDPCTPTMHIQPGITTSIDDVLVLGMGNPLLGDDSFGWRVLETLQQEIGSSADSIELDCMSLGGLRLMERMVDYDAVILIDAITTGQKPIGSFYCCALDDLPQLAIGHFNSAHDTSLPAALGVGRMLGVALPEIIWVVGVEIQPTYEFSESLTPSVSAAIPVAAKCVTDLLRQLDKEVL